MIEGATIRTDGDEDRLFRAHWDDSHLPSLQDIADPDGDDVLDGQLEGHLGMVALGGGWKSIDLLVAVQQIMLRQRRNVVALAVDQRIDELLTHHPDRDEDFWEGAPPMTELDVPWWTPRLLSSLATVVLVIAELVAIVLGIPVVRALRQRWLRRAPRPA